MVRVVVGVPGFLGVGFLGVPDLRGRPRRLGVAASSSVIPRRGTTVVVTVSSLRRGVLRGVGDWKRRRLTFGSRSPESSASTVTRILCGAMSFPTSSSNVCFLGEGPRDM